MTFVNFSTMAGAIQWPAGVVRWEPGGALPRGPLHGGETNMNDSHFDDLTRRLAAPVSRRAAFKAMIGTALGGALGLKVVGDVDTAGASARCPAGTVYCTDTKQCTPDNPPRVACNGVCCSPGQTCAAGKCSAPSCLVLGFCGPGNPCPPGYVCANSICISNCLIGITC